MFWNIIIFFPFSRLVSIHLKDLLFFSMCNFYRTKCAIVFTTLDWFFKKINGLDGNKNAGWLN